MLALLSDLHLEQKPAGNWSMPTAVQAKAEAFLLLGDIWEGGLQSVTWAQRLEKPVFLVPGNHEFYGSDVPSRLEQLREAAARTANVTVLYNDAVVWNGIRLLGTTLWTDFLFHGLAWRDQAMQHAVQSVSDFSLIFHNKKTLKPATVVEWHEEAVAWLECMLRTPFDGSTWVLTHHAPSAHSVADRYQEDLVTAAFASRLDDRLLGRSEVWGHGHTHHDADYCVADTRVVCRPKGFGAMPDWSPMLLEPQAIGSALNLR